MLAGEEYKEKTRLQGKYLKNHLHVVYVCALIGDSIYQIQSHWMVDFGVCFAMEAVLFALMVKPFYQIQTLQTLVKFRFAQI